MSDNGAAANDERARAYLQAIENRVSEQELADLFSSDVVCSNSPAGWYRKGCNRRSRA